ncbi:MAG TPA: hypothetical protein VH063_02505 [Gaiellaceae bacterium]|nr:hypothetical protein [Gaiellaceae bacterium]
MLGSARRIGGILVTVVVLAAVTADVARSTTPPPPLTPSLIRYWTAVAKCETGAGGAPKWNWGSRHRPNEGTLYEGGVGFSTAMWKQWAAELGWLTLFPDAFDAPPRVQMTVAQYGAIVHKAQWGCKP